MSFISRTLTAAVVLLSAGNLLVTADEPAPPAPPPRRAERRLPSQAPQRAPTVDPELEAILQEWERASAGRLRLDAKFSRYSYDDTFEVEKRATGSLAVDNSGRAVYRLQPEDIRAGEVSHKKNRSGVPFTLKPDDGTRWHWTGARVMRVDEQAQTFELFEFPRLADDGSFRPEPPALPDEQPADNSVEVPAASRPNTQQPSRTSDPPRSDKPATFAEAILSLIVSAVFRPTVSLAINVDSDGIAEALREFWLPRPFLLGTTRDDLMRRFDVQLVKRDANEVRLKFRPRQGWDQRWFNQAVLLLRRGDFVPLALKMADVTGAESVHVFSDVRVIHAGGPDAKSTAPLERLDRPDLRGYRRIQAPEAAFTEVKK